MFPPSFDLNVDREPDLGLEQKMNDFIKRVERIRELVDAFLIVDLKSEERLKVSTIFAAHVLRESLGVESIPVVTARDCNRPASRSNILTALSAELDTIMVVWGDRYGKGEGAKNVYDYETLGEFIHDARQMANRVRRNVNLIAPVDLGKLSNPLGVQLAKSRLAAGADFLLAQPPTTEEESLTKHMRVLKRVGLTNKVMLNVFPFRSVSDIRACREKFGWEISTRLEGKAALGESELLVQAKRVASKIENSGVPGLYVSTRGKPELLRYILE